MVVPTATVAPHVGRARLALDPGSAELSRSLVLGSARIPSFRGQAMGDQGFTPSWPKICALFCREPGLTNHRPPRLIGCK
jgi:hypothetical protein